jgi:DnaJ-class molecular chaperone
VPTPPAELPADLNALFGDLFGQSFSGKLAADLSVDLALTETEAATGVTRDVVLPRLRGCTACEGRGSKSLSVVRLPCGACNATGKREVTQGFFKVQSTCGTCRGAGLTTKDPCGTCTGTGRVSTEAKVSVTVPANVEHGQILKLEGEGSLGEEGAMGLLYVYILVGDRPDPRADAFAAAAAHHAAPADLPTAQVHRAPMPTWQVATLAVIVLAMLAALLVAR